MPKRACSGASVSLLHAGQRAQVGAPSCSQFCKLHACQTQTCPPPPRLSRRPPSLIAPGGLGCKELLLTLPGAQNIPSIQLSLPGGGGKGVHSMHSMWRLCLFPLPSGG